MSNSPARPRGSIIGLLTILFAVTLQSQAPPLPLPTTPLIFAGSGPGGGLVRVLQADGTPLATAAPFGNSFTGGVRVAAGDVNGDGITDVVVAMASGGGQVRVFSGADGAPLGESSPFGAGFTGGVFVATGDVNADGHDDLLLGAGTGSGLAKLIDGATLGEVGPGAPFGGIYTGGVTVAMGDVNGDGRADLIFGTAFGGLIRIFDGPTLAPLVAAFPYGPLFPGGVHVAAGDVNGDGIDEVAVAPRSSGGPVRVYTMQAELLIEGYPFNGVRGVNLAMHDLNGDGRDDLVMGAGAGAAPSLRTFSILDRTLLLDVDAFDPGFTGGVFVATPSSARSRFTSANTTTFTAGTPGTFSVTTSNGASAVLSVGGTLPAGVTFTDHGNGTATLAGTPAAGTGGSYALTFVATRDGRQVASQPFTLVVQEPAAITSPGAATFAIGSANTFTVTTTGHPAPPTIASAGTLPAGVTFTDHGNGTASLSGSPASGSEGTYPLTLTASNGVGSPAVQGFVLTVVAGGTPLFTSADQTTFSVGAVGSFSIQTSALPVASTITITGALPADVTFTDHGNGTATLAGVPAVGTAGSYPLVFTADNGVATTSQSFTLTVTPVAGGAPAFTSGNATTFAVGAASTFAVTTSGTPAPVLSLSGALPAGVAFTDHGDGTASLAGTPDAGTAGTYPLQFTATSAAGTATQEFTLTIGNVGGSPLFTSGATTAFVVGASEGFAITTEATPPVTAITVTGTLPAGITFTDNGNGTAMLAGIADPGTGGAYPLTFTATNGVGAPVIQAFTLNVQQTASFVSADARAFTVGIADSFLVETDGVPLAALTVSGGLPGGVTFTDNGNGTATIAGTANPGTVGTYALTLTATNGVGAPVTQAFTLAVTENTPPTLDAITDPAAIAEDAVLQTVTLSGISAGAGDSQPLAVTAASSDPTVIPVPTVIYTSPGATGTLQYTPVPNASGSSVITVTVTDGGLDNDLATQVDNGVISRTFTVTVTPVNDLPTLDAIADPAPIAEDAAQQTINLSGIGAGSGETQPLQITATSDTVGVIPNPTVTYTSPAATGSLAYTPVAGASGSAIITVVVTDGGLDNDLGTAADNLTATRTFTVVVTNVDDSPTLDAIPDPAAINEDAGLQTITLAGISAGAGETSGLVVTASSSNPTLIPNPAVTYTSPNATGSLSYTPVANTSGSAVITVAVSDGGAVTTQRTFTVVVNEVNDAPTFTPGADQTVTEDAPAQTVANFLGTVSAGPNEGSQVVTVTIDNVTNPSLFSAGPAIGPTGVLTYTPAAEQFGVATVTYTVSDNGGTANGGVDSVGPQTFTITLTAVNDLPTLDAIADPAAILEDAAPQTVNLAGISTGSVGESAQPLQVTAVSGNTAVIPNPTVTWVSPSPTGSLAYTPVANASGSAVITVTVTDGGLDNDLGTAGDNGTVVRTFTVTVTAVNDAPSFTKGARPDGQRGCRRAERDRLGDGDLSRPERGGQTVSFEITNNTNTGLFSAGPAVSATGTLTYTPAANQNGTATITLRVTDTGGTANGGIDVSATQTFVITVTAVNDAPVALAKNYAAQANMLISGLSGLLVGVTDADTGVNGCTPTFSVANVSATTPPGGDITNLNVAAGTFDFNPPPGVTGNVTFSYQVSDTGCPGTATSAPATVTVAVAGPVIWFVNPVVTGPGDGRLTNPFRVLANSAGADADDVDAADHRIFVYSGTVGGGLTLNASEWLVGQGATAASFDVLMGIAPPTGTAARPTIGGTRPTVSLASGTTLTLATGNVVSGVNVINTNGSGISGANVGTLALSHFDVTVTGGAALSLTGSGTVTATGADNDLNSANNTALNVNAVTIGAAGLTFKSISAGAGANLGVSLVNTGAGGLTVTGIDGPDAGADPDLGSGGTINGKTGADGSTTAGSGLFFSSANNISLNGMVITNHQNYGIRGAQVDGFRLTFSQVGGVNGTNVASPFSDGSVSFIGTPATGYGLRGAVAFLDNEITGGAQRNVSIDNATGTMNLDFQRNNVHHTGASFGDDGLAIEVDTTAVLVATVANNTFAAHGGDHFNLSLVNSANATLTFTNNDMQGGHAIGLGQGVFVLGATYNGTFSYNISNNGTVADPFVGNLQGGAIHVNKGSGTGTFSGTIASNVIGNPAVVGSGSAQAFGIIIGARGAGGSHTTLINNNQVRQYFDRGIVLEAGEGSAALNATVTNNTVSNFADAVNSLHGIHSDNGILAGDTNAVCLNISANSVATAANEPAGGADIRVRRGSSTTVAIPGIAGTNNAAAIARLQALNPSANTVTVTGDGFSNVASCPVP